MSKNFDDRGKVMMQSQDSSVALSPGAFHRFRIRVAREESAFVYAVLEASEGICFYSTLPHQNGEMHRDLDLMVPMGFVSQVRALLDDLNLDLFQGVHLIQDEVGNVSEKSPDLT